MFPNVYKHFLDCFKRSRLFEIVQGAAGRGAGQAAAGEDPGAPAGGLGASFSRGCLSASPGAQAALAVEPCEAGAPGAGGLAGGGREVWRAICS